MPPIQASLRALIAAALLAPLLHADGTFLGTNYCQATVNSSGAPAHMTVFGPNHAGSGAVFMDDQVILGSGPVPRQGLGLFLYASSPTQVPFGDGNLCLAGSIKRLPLLHSSQFGQFQQGLTFADTPGFAPGTWYFQSWFRDPSGGPAGFNLSDGIELVVSP